MLSYCQSTNRQIDKSINCHIRSPISNRPPIFEQLSNSTLINNRVQIIRKCLENESESKALDEWTPMKKAYKLTPFQLFGRPVKFGKAILFTNSQYFIVWNKSGENWNTYFFHCTNIIIALRHLMQKHAFPIQTRKKWRKPSGEVDCIQFPN